MIRSHGAGTLRASDAGSRVTLAGWVSSRRDHGGVAFIDLRDSTGVCQVVIRDEDVARTLRPESCVRVSGDVEIRPEGNDNAEISTGAIEVMSDVVEVLSESAPLPFGVDEYTEVGEEARLKWRYLDLRRPGPAKALRMRSK